MTTRLRHLIVAVALLAAGAQAAVADDVADFYKGKTGGARQRVAS